MGYKATNLTHKPNKNFNSSKIKGYKEVIISKDSQLYKKYKKLYIQLKDKYPQAKHNIALSSIMKRGVMGTKISSQQNRQLALLDIDKLISFSNGSMSDNDPKMIAMRMVIDMEGPLTNNSFLFLRRNRDEARNQPQEEPALNEGRQIRIINENIEINQQQTPQRQQRQDNPNALNILRLVRAARLHFMMANNQLPTNGPLEQEIYPIPTLNQQIQQNQQPQQVTSRQQIQSNSMIQLEEHENQTD